MNGEQRILSTSHRDGDGFVKQSAVSRRSKPWENSPACRNVRRIANPSYGFLTTDSRLLTFAVPSGTLFVFEFSEKTSTSDRGDFRASDDAVVQGGGDQNSFESDVFQ